MISPHITFLLSIFVPLGPPSPAFSEKEAGFVVNVIFHNGTIKGGFRRVKKSCNVLMMMKAAKLGLAGPGAGQEQTRSRPGVGQD